jgi:hypothetical protein
MMRARRRGAASRSDRACGAGATVKFRPESEPALAADIVDCSTDGAPGIEGFMGKRRQWGFDPATRCSRSRTWTDPRGRRSRRLRRQAHSPPRRSGRTGSRPHVALRLERISVYVRHRLCWAAGRRALIRRTDRDARAQTHVDASAEPAARAGPARQAITIDQLPNCNGDHSVAQQTASAGRACSKPASFEQRSR